MVEEVLPGLFRVRMELPRIPVERLNSAYIVKGERNLIIDAGMASGDCQAFMEAAFHDIGVKLEESDFFVTHFHMDHLSLAVKLQTRSSRLYFNDVEADEFWSNTRWEERFQCARENGFPENEIEEVRRTHTGYRTYVKRPSRENINFYMIPDDAAIHAGDYHFRVIVTSGHSESHMCLYDAGKRLFFSGDHLLGQIVPAVSDWRNDTDSLGDYLESLSTIETHQVAHAMPGHGEPFDFRTRIEELRVHHSQRLAQVLSVLTDSAKSAYEVAAELSVSNGGAWDRVSVLQKWFSTGEILAYLVYLHKRRRVMRKSDSNCGMAYCV